ncbi:MAG: Maf family protein [Flavobacteriales bacterium]
MLYPHLEGRRVVLASQSPRRRELMGMLGLEVECMARDVDESWPQELEGVGVAEYVARKKAAAYLDVLGPSDVLITGDTVVVLHGKVLEKPTDEAHACEMLRALSGQTHTVASAVAVTTLEHGTHSALDLCEVTFDTLDESFVQAYVGTGSPMDKAGAYGVQDLIGLVGVESMKGSFYTVMGMPTHRLHSLLLEVK